MSEHEFYYEVAVSLPATWKQHIYTYTSDVELALGSIVLVPFGAKAKIGYVVKQVAKPDFAAKKIDSITPFRLPETSRSLLDWLIGYYPTTPGVHIQHVLPAFVQKLSQLETSESEAKLDFPDETNLTEQQAAAFEKITNPSAPQTSVIHGVTGSGKTRLYAEIAKHQLEAGKNVLILYPEISLTSQLKKELQKYLGNTPIHPYHSKLAPKKQRETWLHAHNATSLSVFIGPRSALFLPVKDLGAVIIDEAHDSAYKQDSGTRYNGVIVAGALAAVHNAKLILGSATPPVQETQQILSKGGQLITMDRLAKNDQTSREFRVVDMTKKQNRSQVYQFSKELITSIQKSLDDGKQSLLFLNRRGTARMMLCENCGWHAECPNCDTSLTFHHDSFTLQCHICGYSRKSEISCPDCSHELTQRTPGIKAMEQELKRLFPSATIARYDSDNHKKDSFSENFTDVRDGKVDIIIGTQLITKGLDLPLLETVGVLEADGALLLPDYSSHERAFQQLLQVSGRVGRGHSSGRIVIQTYQPDSPLFKYILRNDWPSFYTDELESRQAAGFPPFRFAMKAWTLKSSPAAAQKNMQRYVETLTDVQGITVLGPAPSFYEKSHGKYVWQVAITAPSRKTLTILAADAPKDIICDLDPVSLL